MAHFAQLDENNVVTQVLVVTNDVIMDSNGQEQESLGIEYLRNLFGNDTNWKQTSYNSKFRKQYAGIGYTYYTDLDMFIEPKLFNSWILNNATGNWEAPTPYPNDGNHYGWDEENLTWIQVTPPPLD